MSFRLSVLNECGPSGLHLHWCIPWYCTVDTFTIFHCYFFLPFVHPFYLFIYHFISFLITFPFCFSVDLHLQSLYFVFWTFCTCAPLHSVFSLVPCTCSINTSRHTVCQKSVWMFADTVEIGLYLCQFFSKSDVITTVRKVCFIAFQQY